MPSSLKFFIPQCGAVRDVKELEYICALHQSKVAASVRSDEEAEDGGGAAATAAHHSYRISVQDIRALILSRHGIQVSVDELVELDLVQDLGGHDSLHSTCPGLDLAQLTSLLMIPKWKRAAQEQELMFERNNETEPAKHHVKNNHDICKEDDDTPTVFESLLQILRRNLGLSDTDPPPQLNHELMRAILAGSPLLESEWDDGASCSGTGDDDDDETTAFITELIQHAGGEGVPLDATTLQRALTSDLSAYNTHWETSRTLFSDDVISMMDGGLDELLKGTCCKNLTIKKTTDGTKDAETGGENDHDVEISSELQLPAPSCRPKEGSTDTNTMGGGFATLQRLSDQKTFSVIDLTADTFSSDLYFVVLFLSTILAYLSYGFVGWEVDCQEAAPLSRSPFGCQVGMEIVNWLMVFVTLGLGGGIYCAFASSGNAAFKECPLYKKALGVGVVIVFTILPATDTTPFMERTTVPFLQWAPYATLVAGSLLLFQQGIYLLKATSPRVRAFFHQRGSGVRKEVYTKHAQVHKVDGLFQHALELHNLPRSRRTKSFSSSRSFGTVGSTVSSEQTSALINFQSKQHNVELAGGWWWTGKRMLSGSIVEQEGVFLGARVWSAHFGQLIALGLFVSILWASLQYVQDEYQTQDDNVATLSVLLPAESRRSLYFNASGSFLLTPNDIPDESFLTRHNLEFAYEFDDVDSMRMYQESPKDRLLRSVLVSVSSFQETAAIIGFETESLEELLSQKIQNATGLDLDLILDYAAAYVSFQGSFVEFAYEEVKKRVTQQEVISSILFGGILSLFGMLANITVFLPSYICQTLQYRYGAKGVLWTSDRFQNQRRGKVWDATYLFGLAFWGVLFSGLIVAAVLGGTFFLFIWSETSTYMLGLLALLIAICVTFLLKKFILVWAKQRSYSALYRTNLALANGVTILMEAWNVGLTLGLVFGRALILILTACVFVGRVDINFLAPHINFFGLAPEEDHEAFAMDILVHEAHRHPYLERLAQLYLVKIYQGKAFITRTGSAWRLVSVLMLMPWLRSYSLVEGGANNRPLSKKGDRENE